MNAIQSLVTDFMYGFKDALFGMVKVYKYSRSLPQRVKKAPEPRSILAQRRAAERPVSTEVKEKRRQPIIMMILRCCVWNGGIFWLSIVIFNSILIPYLRIITQFIFGSSNEENVIWQWMWPVLSYLFSALWVMPLFLLSKIVNSLWFQDIADRAYRETRGRPQFLNVSQFIADFVFSTILQMFFLIQAMLIKFVPVIGPVASFIHICLLYSLYAFEYKWFNMGWPVNKRISYVEYNWSYFCGFGFPIALCTSLFSSFVISACVFAILFPLCIVSANEARSLTRQSEIVIHFFNISVGATRIVFRQTLEKWIGQSQHTQSASHATHSQSSHR